MGQAWKRSELKMARDVGTERIPVDGRSDGSADWDDGLFVYQLKVRRALPSWLFDWLAGIVAWGRDKQRIGVLVLNRPRQPRSEALVVIRWSDWVDLHGPAQPLDGHALEMVITEKGADDGA